MAIEAHRYVYLSPQDDCRSALLAAARAAKSSLHLCIYGFSLVALGQILIDKKASGITVGVVADRRQSAGRPERALLQYLVDQGVPVTITTSTQHGAIMHLKALIVDAAPPEAGGLGVDHNDSFIAHGSYNFSSSAQDQANSLITENSSVLCSYFWGLYEQLRQYGLAHCAQLTPTAPPSHPA